MTRRPRKSPTAPRRARRKSGPKSTNVLHFFVTIAFIVGMTTLLASVGDPSHRWVLLDWLGVEACQ